MMIAAILLAAGRSRRFGARDKLSVPLDGRPLGLHAASALADLPFLTRIVVTGTASLTWPDFEVVPNDDPDAGMAHSIALGVTAAHHQGAEAVLIALADMPFVSREHFERLIAAYRGPESIAASSDGIKALPPALFGADWFEKLQQLAGDQGARALLDGAERIRAAANQLIDIDCPDDLEAVARQRR